MLLLQLLPVSPHPAHASACAPACTVAHTHAAAYQRRSKHQPVPSLVHRVAELASCQVLLQNWAPRLVHPTPRPMCALSGLRGANIQGIRICAERRWQTQRTSAPSKAAASTC